MIHIERTHDMGLVRGVHLHPAVLPGVADERYDAAGLDWTRADVPGAVHLAVWDVALFGAGVRDSGRAAESRVLLGTFLAHPDLPVAEWPGRWEDARRCAVWQGHSALLPAARGRAAVRAYREAFGWMWAHTDALRIVGVTPEDHRPALRVACWAGMERVGRRPRAYREHGAWRAGVVSAIERPAAAPQAREVAA